jgi:hypothetical protein
MTDNRKSGIPLIASSIGVGPAVQKNDQRPIGETSFGVSDIQNPSIDLLELAERRVRSRFDRGQICRYRPVG